MHVLCAASPHLRTCGAHVHSCRAGTCQRKRCHWWTSANIKAYSAPGGISAAACQGNGAHTARELSPAADAWCETSPQICQGYRTERIRPHCMARCIKGRAAQHTSASKELKTWRQFLRCTGLAVDVRGSADWMWQCRKHVGRVWPPPQVAWAAPRLVEARLALLSVRVYCLCTAQATITLKRPKLLVRRPDLITLRMDDVSARHDAQCVVGTGRTWTVR